LKLPSLLIKWINSETHSYINSFASLDILAFGEMPYFIILYIFAIGKYLFNFNNKLNYIANLYLTGNNFYSIIFKIFFK